MRSPTCPSRVSSSRKSAQQTVRGNHACHGATPRNSSPRGCPAAIALSPSCLSHLLFAQTQFSTHPSQTQPLSPLPPSFSLLGAALASGEQLVAHSSPGLVRGGTAGDLGVCPLPLSWGRRRRAPAGRQRAQSEPRVVLPARAPPRRVFGRRGSASSPLLRVAQTGEHAPPRSAPLVRPRPLAGLAPPHQEPSPSQPCPALPQSPVPPSRRAPPRSAPPRLTYRTVRPKPRLSSPGLCGGTGRRGPGSST